MIFIPLVQSDTGEVTLPDLPGSGLLVKALFDYDTPQEEGELAFRKGDVRANISFVVFSERNICLLQTVTVIERGADGAWWSGLIGDRVGLFPSNFFSLDGKRIRGPDDDLDDDEDDEDDGQDVRARVSLWRDSPTWRVQEFEKEERMLDQLEQKRLEELAAERARRKEALVREFVPHETRFSSLCQAREELEAERRAAAERTRLAREKEELIGKLQADYDQELASGKQKRTRTLTASRLGGLDSATAADLDQRYAAKVLEAEGHSRWFERKEIVWLIRSIVERAKNLASAKRRAGAVRKMTLGGSIVSSSNFDDTVMQVS